MTNTQDYYEIDWARHGRASAVNKEALNIGDPYVDPNWMVENAERMAASIGLRPFDQVITGPEHRLYQTGEGVLVLLPHIKKPAEKLSCLRSRATFYEGKLYGDPEELSDSLNRSFDRVDELDAEMFKRGAVNVLAFGSGLQIAAHLARSVGMVRNLWQGNVEAYNHWGTHDYAKREVDYGAHLRFRVFRDGTVIRVPIAA